MSLVNAFGDLNKDALRIRTFTLGGHTFKVKVPLTAETDAIYERSRVMDEAKALKYYAELSKEFIDNKDKYIDDKEVEYKENDILIRGKSLMETARNKVLTQNRITEMVRLLVPENKDFDMSKVTYEEIETSLAFAVATICSEYSRAWRVSSANAVISTRCRKFSLRVEIASFASAMPFLNSVVSSPSCAPKPAIT